LVWFRVDSCDFVDRPPVKTLLKKKKLSVCYTDFQISLPTRYEASLSKVDLFNRRNRWMHFEFSHSL